MPVYDVIELIGSSSESWEKAAANHPTKGSLYPLAALVNEAPGL
jgi:hypothetical protein